MHVIPRIFLSYMSVNNNLKNTYLFSVDKADIYVDLSKNIIVTNPKIKVESIFAQLSFNKRIDFKFTYNNQSYTWSYRYVKASNSSELFLLTKKRTDQESSNLGRDTKITVPFDGIKFCCEWKDKLPDNLEVINGDDIIFIKNEEPTDD